MNKNSFRIYTILLALFIGFAATDTAFAQRKKKKKSKKKKETPVVSIEEPSKKDLRKAEELFIYAVNEYLLEEYDQALELLLKCNDLNPKDDGIKYQTALAYSKIENYQRSLQFSKRALELDPENKYYYKLVAQNYEVLNLLKDALMVLEKQIEETGDDEEAYFQIAMLYLQMGAPRNAIEYFDIGEEKYGINDVIVRQKQRIYIRLGDLEAALKEGQKLINAYPDELTFKYSQVRLLLGNNRTDEALEMLEPILKNNPNEGEGHFLMANIYRNQGESENYYEELKKAFGCSDQLTDESFNILAGYLQFSYNEKKRFEAEELINIAMGAHPNDDRLMALNADFLISQKKYDLARTYYLKSLEKNANNFKLWKQVISIDWELQQVDSVDKHADMAIEYFPNQALLYLYSGSAKLQKKDYDEAEVIFTQGLQLVVDPSMKIDFNSQLGDTYYQMDDYAKAFTKYDEVLKVDPLNIYVLNNYAYYLSLRKENLEKAEEMSYQTIVAEPENDTYLDTYGWVLFVKGDYKKAEEYLKKAADISQASTVIEHYGDVLIKLGKTEEALEQWEKAKKLGGEVSDQLDQKINQKKYIE
ncbi:tetratricopeptide repeat protein [Flammeovirga agarivorans]|uniref:Tetratricopeptide repeat protein n=1 Tax=Flammeovirga agarivorans TaxID=2726742 RepID=A0A7X8SLL4_9BACT|nr:tetratricopeptide repeat protein [Flammeovirga agarivorans]NLR92395.1 tetratricopeptide repeat protein [Flammeovirga agarivorans]